MREKLVAQRGFTLVEVSIILLTLTVLSSIMLPQLGNYNRLARYVRVKEDLGAICSVLKMMLDDVAESAFYIDPGPDHPPNRHVPIGLLVGEGDIPLGGSADYGEEWRLPYADEFGIRTDGGNLEPWFWVDKLGNHLIANAPLGSREHRWRTGHDMERGFNSLFAWRGPYISDEIFPDPWGNRYMANVFALYNPPGAGPFDRYNSGVVCYSAGPDAAVDTNFNQPDGWETGDDDVTALLHAGGPM